jgi:hypothetical protein
MHSNSLQAESVFPIPGRVTMPHACERCRGAAEPAARMRTFEYMGQSVRCLMLVSSCVVCGYQWEDEAYGAENELFAQQARATFLSRLQAHRDSLEADANSKRVSNG